MVRAIFSGGKGNEGWMRNKIEMKEIFINEGFAGI
jgi:hypothetical protein